MMMLVGGDEGDDGCINDGGRHYSDIGGNGDDDDGADIVI
jgi:hypothetical protein